MTDTPSMHEISSMSPAEATAALAAMSAASNPPPSIVPQDSQDARAQLDLLTRDPTFAQALMSGNGAAKNQFDKLVAMVSEADVVGDALANIQEQPTLVETTMDGELPSRVVREVVAGMRAFNISDGAIKEAIAGTPISAHEHAAVKALETMRHGDADWVKRLMAKDFVANREHLLMCDLLSRPIAEAK
jgi:hypothetical protein